MPRRSYRPAVVFSAACSALAWLAVGGATARADDTEVTRRTLTLPRGVAELGADLEVNLSVREVYEPISIAPDLRYGVTGAFTVGLVHSFRSQSLADVGNGVCLTGADAGCADPYRGTSLELMYAAVSSGHVDSAVRMRLTARDYDPLKLSWKIGLLMRHRQGRFAIVSDPHIAFGLTNTDQGNASFIDVPVWLQVQATRSLLPYVRTGIEGVVTGFGDTYRVPFGLGLVYSRGPFDFGAELVMPRSFGPQNDSKPRLLRAYVTWRPAIARHRPRAGS